MSGAVNWTICIDIALNLALGCIAEIPGTYRRDSEHFIALAGDQDGIGLQF